MGYEFNVSAAVNRSKYMECSPTLSYFFSVGKFSVRVQKWSPSHHFDFTSATSDFSVTVRFSERACLLLEHFPCCCA